MNAFPTRRLFLLLSTLFLLSYLPTPSSSSSGPLSTSSSVVLCNKDDYAALMKIKAAFHNASYFASWIPNTDCCNWTSVKCGDNSNSTNRITSLYIASAAFIFGHIPVDVGDLPYLESLVLIENLKVTGTIPSTITKLKFLGNLALSHNNLSGPIPSFLSQLPNLHSLDLSTNQFSGSIPSSLSDLPKLKQIILNSNSLTGVIPESFGKFQSRQSFWLDLSNNQLSGEIPKSFGDIDFFEIDLSGNKFVGDASMLFKANGSTEMIELSMNQMLEYNLSNVEIGKNLMYLRISHNKIFGSIPEAVTRMSNWQYFDVSYNLLCGKIPQGGNLQQFDSSSFYPNKCLCGAPLAACK
ncbi:polygalacturonase inhibitor 2-like [Macadamia integrifolia]|uniref:polygalacturonase inhibitor 2-like n=1 Tax=Macadamia integrifolia TaxID=60698 RepID=UPI001C528EDC|nr:polygalacturonase inhibitor 2-like [Macadamia integrifolia]